MQIPTPQDIADMQSYTHGQFTDWLVTGLRNFPLQGRHAFGAPAKTYMAQDFCLGQDLVNLFPALEPVAQREFQKGVLAAMCRVLDKPGADKADDQRVMEELAYARIGLPAFDDERQGVIYSRIASTFPGLQRRYGIPEISL